MSDNSEFFAVLERYVSEIFLTQSEVRRLLYGRKVRFRALLLNGIQRTGTIKSAQVSGSRTGKRSGISIEVAVDRMDGREGVLVESWWGDLNAVEIMDD